MPTGNSTKSNFKVAAVSTDSRDTGKTPDRIALVTGANKAIGLEIARQLAKRGMTVYVGARDSGRGIAAAEKLQGDGLAIRFVELDVLRDQTIRAAAATLEAAHGRFDVLVNNPGIFERGDGPPGQGRHRRRSPDASHQLRRPSGGRPRTDDRRSAVRRESVGERPDD